MEQVATAPASCRSTAVLKGETSRTLECMQLRFARLCLDCEEIHDAQACPICASDSFAYISRWVPAPERRTRPRLETSPDAEVYQQILDPKPRKAVGTTILKGVAGLTALTVAAGWLWQRARPREDHRQESRTPTPEPPDQLSRG